MVDCNPTTTMTTMNLIGLNTKTTKLHEVSRPKYTIFTENYVKEYKRFKVKNIQNYTMQVLIREKKIGG